MDYANLLTYIERLNDPRLNKLSPAQLESAHSQSLDQVALLTALAELGEVTGWMTWPDEVQSITTAQRIDPQVAIPPLEGELVSQDKLSIRFHYNGQAWQLVQQKLPSLNETEAGQANAFAETITLANKTKGEPDLEYIRIWQHDPELGFITRDALFQGFTGGNQ